MNSELQTEEMPAKLPNIKWQILKAGAANILGIKLIDIDENNTLLAIELDKIPPGCSITKYLEEIMETGIVKMTSVCKQKDFQKY